MNLEINTGNEIEITEKDMIVSTTDKKGTIIYANDIFCDIAGYKRSEVIGQPHNMIRHPQMPKAIFKLLWNRVLNGEVIYAFVKNIARNGDYYWVKAYVKPIIVNGEVVKITSYRKPLNSFAKDYITKLYNTLLEYEKTHSVDESLQFVQAYLKERNLTYDQFIDRLSLEKSVENIAIRNIDYNKERNTHLIFKEYLNSCIKNGQIQELEDKKHSVYKFREIFENMKNESFTSDEAWIQLVQNHSKFHASVDKYIQKAKENENMSSFKNMAEDLSCDINNMFNNLTIIRDKY
ncbi:PAS domain-containing protein [Poseidonibacter lekithochrous]|uniref:PAS domain-containing protein n=1 Tax=Poseidonibacter lekithochrous TaxID=1904463 RepID=UPI0008FCD672|nr:PAS domain-containing protein [Poseidonibacter lekithochrous]QKJ22676.1 PAS sensor-containing signal transduction protein [Poseidonibacter lekithochrous]